MKYYPNFYRGLRPSHTQKNLQKTQPGSRTEGRKPGVRPHFPCSGKAGFRSHPSSISQFPGPSLEKYFRFLERKVLPKYRELYWKVPLHVIWRMSVGFEAAISLLKSRQQPRTTEGLLRGQDRHVHGDTGPLEVLVAVALPLGKESR